MKSYLIDPKVIRALELLQPVAARDPDAASRGKAYFLSQALAMRTAISRKQVASNAGWFRQLAATGPGKVRIPVFNTVLAILVAVVIFFGAGASTVYAAQDSLPNQALYPLKTWSEDALLSLTVSPKADLNHALNFTDRRIAEITGLVDAGAPIPAGVVARLQAEMDYALELAAGMDDSQIVQQLEHIRLRAEAQLQTMNALMANSPHSYQAELLRAQVYIQQQLQLCVAGETDLQEFRLQIWQRMQVRDDNTQETGNGPRNPALTPSTAGYGPYKSVVTPTPYGLGPNPPDSTPTSGGYGPHKPDISPEPEGSAPGTPYVTPSPDPTGTGSPGVTPNSYGDGTNTPVATPKSYGDGANTPVATPNPYGNGSNTPGSTPVQGGNDPQDPAGTPVVGSYGPQNPTGTP